MVGEQQKATIVRELGRKKRAIKIRDDGDHEVWRCTCGQQHQTYVPRSRVIKTGTANSIYKRMMPCPLFGKGWLR